MGVTRDGVSLSGLHKEIMHASRAADLVARRIDGEDKRQNYREKDSRVRAFNFTS